MTSVCQDCRLCLHASMKTSAVRGRRSVSNETKMTLILDVCKIGFSARFFKKESEEDRVDDMAHAHWLASGILPQRACRFVPDYQARV